MNLHVLPETVEKLALKHPEAKLALQELFPEVFNSFHSGDIVCHSSCVSVRAVVVGPTLCHIIRNHYGLKILNHHIVTVSLVTGEVYTYAPYSLMQVREK